MNCGCTTEGNPFERNEAILVPCVMHAVWLGVQVKVLELQIGDIQQGIINLLSACFCDDGRGLPECKGCLYLRKALELVERTPVKEVGDLKTQSETDLYVMGEISKARDGIAAERDAAFLQISELRETLRVKTATAENLEKGIEDAGYKLEQSNRLIEELKKFSLLFAEGMSAFTAGKPVSDAPAQEKNHLAHPWISGWLYSRYIVFEEKAMEKRKHELPPEVPFTAEQLKRLQSLPHPPELDRPNPNDKDL